MHPLLFFAAIGTSSGLYRAKVGAPIFIWKAIKHLPGSLIPLDTKSVILAIVALFSVAPAAKTGQEIYRGASGHYTFFKERKGFQEMVGNDPVKAYSIYTPREISRFQSVPIDTAEKIHFKSSLDIYFQRAALATITAIGVTYVCALGIGYPLPPETNKVCALVNTAILILYTTKELWIELIYTTAAFFRKT